MPLLPVAEAAMVPLQAFNWHMGFPACFIWALFVLLGQLAMFAVGGTRCGLPVVRTVLWRRDLRRTPDFMLPIVRGRSVSVLLCKREEEVRLVAGYMESMEAQLTLLNVLVQGTQS